MASVEVLESALRKADAAARGGDESAATDAKRLAGELVKLRNPVASATTQIGGDVRQTASDMNMLTHGASSSQTREGVNPPADESVISREGLPFGQAKDLMAADGPEQRRLALDRVGPKASLKSDSSGRDYVVNDGKRTYVESYSKEGGKWPEWLMKGAKGVAENVSARPAETGLSVLGGALAGPEGLLLGMEAAGLGAAGGRVIDEGGKAARGLSTDDFGDLGKKALTSGASGAASELGARVPGAIAKGGLPQWLTGATDETNRVNKRIMEYGGQARYKTGSPGLAAAEYKTAQGEGIGFKTGSNVGATLKEVESYLNRKGVTDVQGTLDAARGGQTPYLGTDEAKYGSIATRKLAETRAALAKEMGTASDNLSNIQKLNDTAKQRAEQRLAGVDQQAKRTAKSELSGAKSQLSGAEKAQKIEFDRKVVEQKTQQDALAAQQLSAARQQATQSLEVLRSGRGRPAGDLQVTVANDARNAQKAYSDSFAARYGELDRAETGLVSHLSGVAKVASDILESLPKGADGRPLAVMTPEMAPKIQMLEQLKSSGGMQYPIGKMAAIRSGLYDLGGVRTLMDGPKKYLMRQLYKAADKAIDESVPTRDFGDGLLGPLEQKAHVENALALRDSIGKDYAAYKKKFDDVLLERLVKDAGTRGSIDAENVVHLATSSPNQFMRIYNIVGKDTQRRISRGVFDEMVGAATRGQEIDAQAFADQLKGNFKILRPVFGKDSEKIVQAANGLLAVDGKIPFGKGLMPENVLAAIKTATNTQKQINDYFSKHSLALMATGDAAQNRAIQEAKLLVSKKQEELAALSKKPSPSPTPEQKQEFAQRIADAGNKVGARADKRIDIAQGQFGAAKKKLEDFDAQQLSKLADPNYLKDGAINEIVKPRSEELLKHFFDMHDASGPEIKAVQEAFARKAIASGVRDLSDSKGAFSGGLLRDFLKGYSKGQKDMLLGPGGEAELLEVSKFFDQAFPAGRSDTAAQFSSGAQKSKISPLDFLNPKSGWPIIAKYGSTYVKAFLLNHPFTYKLLVTGFDYADTPKGKAAIQTLDNMMRAEMQTQGSP